ncbi:lactonase family protein [Catalinimonas niigatensis]|uniref:lactonase family protein n=1 Tax=Catalinimonas niigatensis TaxID=1397264 RepID=UPI0026653B9F|nr:lactonase family protein [Catalinimonas niigatensis]WPP49547.1 lactonase family protein [Catalinimonas niigatensis]
MKYRSLILLSCLLLCFATVFAQSSSKEILYVGTYSDRGSQGIYVLEFDRTNGKLTEIQTLDDKESPSFLEVHPNGKYLYAVYREGMNANDKSGTVTAFEIDSASGKLSKLNEQSSEGGGPCHVSIDPKGKLAYVSNYGGGNLAIYPIREDGSLGEASDRIQHHGSSVNENRQKEPHMHSIIPSENGKFIYASDLGIDKIMIYQPDRKSGKLSPAKTPYAASTPGAGPRHFTFHPDGKLAFSIEELSSTIASYSVDKNSGALTPIDQVATLPEDAQTQSNTTADIHVSPDGKFVYGSNRGHDSIVIYKIDPSGKMSYVDHEPTKGAHPRNFCMDDKGEFVFVANRDDDNVVVFKRDAATGKLSYTGNQAKVPAAVCVQQLLLP